MHVRHWPGAASRNVGAWECPIREWVPSKIDARVDARDDGHGVLAAACSAASQSADRPSPIVLLAFATLVSIALIPSLPLSLFLPLPALLPPSSFSYDIATTAGKK
ncbi:hypothetical protein AcV5_004430 [Taiwanofungus camphoratus]|nr:hypothetical protein AcV5_004430 [Antrodia cinnamomea]